MSDKPINAKLPYCSELRSVWRNELPQGASRSVILSVVMSLLIISRFLSLSNLKYFVPQQSVFRKEFMHFYVLAWVVGLAGMLLTYPSRSPLSVVIITSWELADIVVYRAYFVMIKSLSTRWGRFTIRRTLLMALLNFAEIVIGFAVLYLYQGDIVSSLKPSERMQTPISALYFSLITITTVGFGDFIPHDDYARLLVMLELLAGSVMLIFILPALISVVSGELHQD